MTDVLNFVDILAWIAVVPVCLLFIVSFAGHAMYMGSPRARAVDVARNMGAKVSHPTSPWPKWLLYSIICISWLVARAGVV